MSENASPRQSQPTAATRSDLPGECERPLVVALHCSGGDGGQWRKLAAMLAPRFAVAMPNFFGAGGAAGWHGQHAFTLADEARPILALIDECARPVHLVGHSYGGGVALYAALSRPARIASLSLYEPSAFHVLRTLGAGAMAEFAEIEGVARSVLAGLGSGAYADTAAGFVDYWNGAGAWSELRDDIRLALVRWLPHAALHFQALINERTPLAELVHLDCPVLVMAGEHARPPSRRIAEEVARAKTGALFERIRGAGHMGPITHADAVKACIAAHLAAAEATSPQAARVRLDAAGRATRPWRSFSMAITP
jgi:pimeloyl-ACP methyl ester carboxylesterase